MRKLLLLLLLPVFAQAQIFDTGTLQRNRTDSTVRGNFGSRGVMMIPTVSVNGTNGYILVFNSATNKYVPTDPGGIVMGAIIADSVTVDNSTFKVITATNAQSAFNQTDSALVAARSTGWINGGEITGLGDAAPDISAGTGTILDNTDPINPVYTPVSWGAVNDLSVTNNATNYISVNSSGVVSATTTPPSHAEYRTAIQLGRVSKQGGVITGITSQLVPIQQTAPQIWDVFRAYGTVKRDLTVSAASTDLTIAVSSGEFYAMGANAHVDPLNPNESEFTANSPQTYVMATRNGITGSAITSLPVGFYDNDGSITAIPGSSSRASIFTVYKFASGNVRVFYGQSYYNSITLAIEAASTYAPIVPEAFKEAIILGYVIATKGATDLSNASNAVFINTNKFGGIGGAIVSAGGFMFTDFSNKSAEVPISIGTFGSTPNANGASYASDVITLQPASASFPGGVTTGTQTFAGTKTFSGNVFVGTNFALQGITGSGMTLARATTADNALISIGNTGGGDWLLGNEAGSTAFRLKNGAGGIAIETDKTTNITTFLATPTFPTASPGDNTTKGATTAFVTAAVSGVTNYWTKSGGNILSPTTSGDVIFASTTASSTSAISGQSTNGPGISGVSSSSSNPGANIGNSSSGPIALFYTSGGTQSSILNNGGFNWDGATATTTAGWDASKNLVSITNTGTGNAVRATSPTLVTPNIGNATGGTLGLSGDLAVGSSSQGRHIDMFISGPLDGRIYWGSAALPRNIWIGGDGTPRLAAQVGGTGGVALASGATAWSAISDENAKVMTEFKPFVNALSSVSSLRAGTTRYKTDAKGVSRSFLIAQDVQKVLPEAVSVDKNGELNLRYAEVIPLLVAAIKELKAEIELLKSK